MDRAALFEATPRGVRVRVRLNPKAAGNRIDGRHADGDGRPVLKARVTASPQGGKANAALIRLLAREWGLPKSLLTITAGASARRKTLLIEGDGKALLKQLNEWMENTHG